jgi:hypothetical protein
MARAGPDKRDRAALYFLKTISHPYPGSSGYFDIQDFAFPVNVGRVADMALADAVHELSPDYH